MDDYVVKNIFIDPGKKTPFKYNFDRRNVIMLLSGPGFVYLSKDGYKNGIDYGLKNGVVYKPVDGQMLQTIPGQVFSLINKPGASQKAHFLVIHSNQGMEDGEV